MKEPNYANGSPFRRNKMRIYFQFSMIGLVCVVVIVVITALVGRKKAIDYSDADFVQVKEPADSAPVVVFETTEGSFKAVLFEDEAPEYCKYFEDLVKDGYFDDTYICTIIRTNDLIGGFIGGSKTEDGASADNTNNDKVDLEISPNMLPLNGTLCSLVQQGGTFRKAKAGSLFTVLGDVIDVEELRSLDAKDVNGFKRVSEMFEDYGGVPSCLQTYTLFGQVYDGWDTLEKIMSVEVIYQDDEDSVNQKPKEEIKITKAYLSTYGENKENGYTVPKKEPAAESETDESK
ncbi:MAG: peptidylprolyl isomerase [Ruminococcus sp.]|nr:peptidylprolyl isomerase [Ruminococcus sp.]